MWREKWVRSDHPIRVQERFTKVRRGGRCNFHAKCGWNLTGFDEVLSERKQSTNPDEYMQMNLGKMSADALVLCLGEWYQDTQYGNSLWPGIQHGTHAQGVMDAVCSPSCSVPNSSSNRAVLLGEPTSWVGTLGLASLWAFSYPRLFLNPFQSTPALLLFLSSINQLLQYKVRNDTAPQSWQLAAQKDFISSRGGQWQDSVTLEVLNDNSMPY